MTIEEALQSRRLFFDGATGTVLQEEGLPPGLPPDLWNLTQPDTLLKLHLAYLEAGSSIVTANMFSASEEKLKAYDADCEKIIRSAVTIARKAVARSGKEAFVAADIGPSGKLLKPYGDLDFEDAVKGFKKTIRTADEAGADLILIETMSDLYECKAAVIAAKEVSALPLFVTLAFNEDGKLFTGADPAAAAAVMESLGVSALGINCGFGPGIAKDIIDQMKAYTDLPLICSPNAGLPKTRDEETYYDLTPEDFAAKMQAMAPDVRTLGGCCGTTPEHIRRMIKACENIPLRPRPRNEQLVVTSYCKSLVFGERALIIGERINPTGKKKLKAALRQKDTAFILQEALAQEEAGADIIDINVGLPDIDETQALSAVSEAVQSVCTLPLQLDSANPEALEKALRRYNGKALINSVNGTRESLDAVLPLVKKYGGALICLTLDDDGIPESARGRLAIAEKIAAEAEAFGIPKRELIVDTLTMPVSAGEEHPAVTLEALKLVKEKLGLKTILGVSNVSFGLPQREALNAVFFLMALEAGLDAAIINPGSRLMAQAYRAYNALRGLDPKSAAYIAACEERRTTLKKQDKAAEKLSLEQCILKGLKEEAPLAAEKEIEAGREVRAIINQELIPALDRIGIAFEEGRAFLPQLLMSAEASKAAFDVLKTHIKSEEPASGPSGETVVIATVKGDIHDIGKNIVKVLLESHRFHVVDLGKDVAPETIADAVRAHDAKLLGLSALMTTTAPFMEKTIRLLRERQEDCKVVVGGAVITQRYAERIGADFYAADATDTVRYAEKILRGGA